VNGTPWSKGQGTIELRKLCGYYCTVPISYQLEGVTKEGSHPQHISRVADIWKGRYNGQVVALKVLRGSRGGYHMQTTRNVSVSHEPLVVVLIDGIEVLQGSGVDEATQAWQYSPFLRGIDDHLRLLPGVSLVRKWEHHGLPEEEARR